MDYVRNTNMGLDQNAYASFNDTNEEDKDRVDLAYWRKHPNLQGWMENLYRGKGGEGEFNCVSVQLTIEDLDSLETAIKDAALPETNGFFFGDDSDDEYREYDLEFIKTARDYIGRGYKVFYSSWW